jgi:hypothetical protein
MKEFMIHVERIVRPLRASHARKMRMRQELLAHLQAAFDEDRDRCPDEATAAERAMQRLGDPAQLALQLQKTLPLLQRLMYIKVPCHVGLDELERISPVAGMLALIAEGYLSLGALVKSAPFLFSRAAIPGLSLLLVDHPVRFLAGSLVLGFIMFIWMCLCFKFTATVALSVESWRPKHASPLAAGVVGLLSIWTLLAAAMTGHAATISLIGRSVVFSSILLLILTAMGRLIARIPRPEEKWLTLDIAG